jgi:tape measure domain-containing protein
MSDAQFVNINAKLNADQLRAELTGILTEALNKQTNELAKLMDRAFKDIGDNAERAAKRAADAFEGVQGALGDVAGSVKAVNRTTDALGGSFGSAFDPNVLSGFNDALIKLVQLQAKLASGTLTPEGLVQTSQEIKLVNSELVAFRESFLSAGRAADEASRNIARDTRQASRESIEASRASTARFVVDQQAQASAARDAARRRVALIQATARTIATIERGLSNIFRQTARLFSSAFVAAGNTISGVANGIGRAFTNTTTNIRNSVTNSNSEVTRSYRKSFGDTTNTVRNETRQQTSIISNFAREASSSISSIGSGARFGIGAAIGGILGVGAARALRGGFERATILENSERALTKLLSSAEDAKKLLTEVTEVVTGTPFRLDQFAAATTQLLAFNVEADKIPEVLRTISDASALSIDPDQTVDRLVRTFGQIQAAGKLATEDINQLTEAGVPAWALLGNQLGKTTNEMRKLVTDGAIPAEQAIDLLLNGIQNGTEGVNGATVAFAGLSKELGSTLKGSLANFNTSISRLGANVITAFKEPFTAALGAATAAVDLLSTGLKTLAVALSESATFQLVQRGLVNLTQALKDAKTALVPFFEFLSGGIVLLAQFAAGFVVLKNIPGALRAVGAAVKFVLAPQRLLIAGVVLLASYFKKLYDDSEDLRGALGKVGAAVGRIATVVKDLAVDAFGAFTGGVGVATDATIGFTDKVLGVVVPALEKVASFLLDTVLPPIRRFAKLIRTEVLPAIGSFLTSALERGASALQRFADIVRSALGGLVDFARAAFEILTQGGTTLGADGWLSYNGPIVKALFALRALLQEVAEFFRAAATILWKGEEYTTGEGWLSEGGVIVRGLTNIRARLESIVGYIRSDFAPVIAGLGVALGTLALTGGNLPLAGIAGLTAGVAVALRNEDIRNALADNIKAGVERARGFLKNLFDGDVLGDIAKGALKAANTIGRVLGDALTDRRLITVVGALAASAVALGVAFVAGLAEGVASNLPELVALIGDTLELAVTEAVQALIDQPLLAAALFSAAAIAKLVLAGRRAGKVLAAAVADGAVTAGGLGVGGGARGLLNGLLGGEAAIKRSAATAGEQYGKTLATAIRNEIRLIQKLGGQLPAEPIGLGRVAGESFVDQNKRLAGSLRTLQAETDKFRTNLGSAAVEGVRLGEGLEQVTSGNVRQGFAQLGAGVKAAGREIATAAGIIAGGAFAAAFVSRAIFDINASGADKLQAGLGLAATGAATFAALGGGPQGAVGAAAVVGVGLLTSALNANSEASKRAQERAQGYADAIKGLATDALRAAQATNFAKNLEGANQDVLESLEAVNFKYSDFTAIVNNSNPEAKIREFVGELRAAGVSGDDVTQTLVFIGREAEAAIAGRKIASLFDGFGPVAEQAKEDISQTAQATDIATRAAGFFKDRVAELNDIRIDGFRNEVDTVKSALQEAGSAADAAKQKVIEFLTGTPPDGGTQQALDDTILKIDGVASGLGELVANNPLIAFGDGIDSSNVRTKLGEVATGIATLLADAPTRAEAEALADELKAGIESEDYGTIVTDIIDDQLSRWNPDAAVFSNLFNEQSLADQLTAKLGAAEETLSRAMAANPLEIPLLLATAEGDTQAFVDDIIGGLTTGLSDDASTRAAAKALGDAVWEELEAALDTSSPSKVTEKIGGFAVAGLVKGLSDVGAVASKARGLGVAAYQGLIAGVVAGIGPVAAAGRALGEAFVRAVKASLKVESPSKVLAEIGEDTIEGFIVGIDSSLPLVDRIAFTAASKVVGEFSAIGTKAARAIGTGFAEGGPDFLRSVSGALDDALDQALSRVEQFRVVGQEIAKALFGSQGTSGLGVVGGGGAEAALQLAFLKVQNVAGEFAKKTQARFEQLGFFSLTFDQQFEAGRANRTDFLQSGLEIRGYAEQLLAAGRSVESVVFETTFWRDQLIAAGLAANASQAQIDEMITSLGLSNNQIADWVRRVNEVTAATAAATTEAERALAAQKAAELAAELRRKAEEAAREAERRAEQEARDAEDRRREEEERRRREYTLPGAVFRDLIIQSPSGDPEAVALAAANRVAFSIRR